MKQTKNKLEQLGFKKVRGTEPGFHMWELTPAKLQQFDENFKPQVASNKPQAASNKQPVSIRKRLDKSR